MSVIKNINPTSSLMCFKPLHQGTSKFIKGSVKSLLTSIIHNHYNSVLEVFHINWDLRNRI